MEKVFFKNVSLSVIPPFITVFPFIGVFFWREKTLIAVDQTCFRKLMPL